MERESLRRAVRDLLRHLHDRPYLASHALAGTLADKRRLPDGEGLRRALIECIEQTKPVAADPTAETGWRRYRLLVMRHLRGQSLEQAADALGVSLRQASRDYHDGVSAVTALLQLRLQEVGEGADRDGAWPDSADEYPQASGELAGEAARVAQSEEGQADLTSVLNSVLQTIERLASARNFRFRTGLSDTLPPLALSRTLLRQALLNVLTYVIRVAPAGGALLTEVDTPRGVALRVTLESPGPLRPVSDDPALQSRLLGAARELLQAQGASLQVGPEDGSRTLLTLLLPVVARRTVLVVDDNPDVVALFRRFLRGEPFRLLQAVSASEALRFGRDLRPNVILLDLMIPSQDGWDILTQLRGDPATRDTPIVICSVLPEQDLARSLGVEVFLDKPVSRAALLAALERCRASPATHPVRC